MPQMLHKADEITSNEWSSDSPFLAHRCRFPPLKLCSTHTGSFITEKLPGISCNLASKFCRRHLGVQASRACHFGLASIIRKSGIDRCHDRPVWTGCCSSSAQVAHVHFDFMATMDAFLPHQRCKKPENVSIPFAIVFKSADMRP